jgi:hypothetical protein
MNDVFFKCILIDFNTESRSFRNLEAAVYNLERLFKYRTVHLSEFGKFAGDRMNAHRGSKMNFGNGRDTRFKLGSGNTRHTKRFGNGLYLLCQM